jgi:transcriptional regulator with XRE-family HTH domain
VVRPRRLLAKTLAARLRDGRKARGWTQEDAAEHCGLVTRHYQKLEAGEINMTLATLERLCDAFGVDASDLLRAT